MSCRHDFAPSDQPSFDVCLRCGTYHSMSAPSPTTLYTPDYWSHERGHSTLAEQVYNCEMHEENGRSKNAFLLDRIETAERGAALEIGCAPGAMLRRLKQEAGFERVVGIDVCPDWEYPIRQAGQEGGDWWFDGFLFFGYFPYVTKGMAPGLYDLILASDVFEHSHEPIGFLTECARLLKPGGQLLMMLPLASPDMLGTRFFEPEEHVYIHNAQNLHYALAAARFDGTSVLFDRWTLGHDTVSARRLK